MCFDQFMRAPIVTALCCYHCFNFVAFRNGTGSHHRGKIAPNGDERTKPKCVKANGEGVGVGASNNDKWTNESAVG
jgi:hypothetical protein